MKESFRLLSVNVINEIENNDFTVELEGNGIYRFSRYSSMGQDFSFSIDIGKNHYEFLDNILEYYNMFDISYEAYLWLDEFGHGKNGAPYEMIDVYKDMEECKEFIYELYQIVKDWWLLNYKC